MQRFACDRAFRFLKLVPLPSFPPLGFPSILPLDRCLFKPIARPLPVDFLPCLDQLFFHFFVFFSKMVPVLFAAAHSTATSGFFRRLSHRGHSIRCNACGIFRGPAPLSNLLARLAQLLPHLFRFAPPTAGSLKPAFD